MARQGSDIEESAHPHVAVVGVGAVTGYGWGRKHLHQGLLSGRPATRPVPGFASQFPTDRLWVARIPDDEPGPPDGHRVLLAALGAAAHEAIDDAHDRGWRSGSTVGVVHCIVPDGNSLAAGAVVSDVVRQFGFHGPVVGVSALTASTVAGILTARSWIESGVADDVLVLNGDVDTSPERCAVLREAGVLAADGPTLERCRPFQEDSAGFAPGEAVMAFVLSARAHGAYGEILGGAMSYDEYHPSPPGLRFAHVERAVREALDNAGTAPGDVAYVNGHGAGIPESDATEAAVVDAVLPAVAGIFSVKQLVGHCQAAGGAVELYASLYGFETGVIPAPPRMGRGHARLLDGPTATVDGLVVKASLGMSGHNAVLVLGPPRR